MSLGLARQGLQVGPYRLAPLAESDIRDLLALFGDPAVVEFMDIDPLESLAEARDIVAWARELALRERGLRWSIRRQGQAALIGTVGLREIALLPGSLEGQISEAVTARAEDRAFDLLPLLTDGRTHAVIIVDGNSHILGLISQTDLLSAVARSLPKKEGPPISAQRS